MGTQKRDDNFKLAPAILDALKTRAELKQAGAAADGDQVLEDAVRKHWPVMREWHYLCEECQDTGWERRRCTAKSRCLRRNTRLCQQPSYEHDYVVPCQCAKGRQLEASLQPRPKADATAAGEIRPRKPWRKLLP